MNPPRRLLLIAGVGALLLAPTGGTSSAQGPTTVRSAGQEQALSLLTGAARAARSRGWSGTQYVSSRQGGATASAVLDVRHDPGGSTNVRPVGGGAGAGVLVPAAAPDQRLLALLSERYELALAGPGRCSGRPGEVVEARRPGGTVAGRFWVDAESGLVLRREVYDAHGRLLRSSAYVDVVVGTSLVLTQPVRASNAAPRVARDEPAALGLPAELPGGYSLFEVERPLHDGTPVLHLAYSDGLSTVSLFRRPGRLGDDVPDGYRKKEVDGTRVLVGGTPERVVWEGGGDVLTLLADADQDDLLAAVAVLPHDTWPQDGLGARFGRGLARVASWVPFV